ncbi:hypothetical protein RB195_026239 [Necator americanus]|uniref:Uncharacterized protein n=1 Tax=Necator americanus TaxID=51031 RepID=A0ABR1EW02_NECAM
MFFFSSDSTDILAASRAVTATEKVAGMKGTRQQPAITVQRSGVPLKVHLSRPWSYLSPRKLTLIFEILKKMC